MWKIEYGGVKDGFFTRNIFIPITNSERREETISKFNNTDVFNTIYLYKDINDIDNSQITGPFIIDLDSDIKGDKDFQRMIINVNFVVNSLIEILHLSENNIRIYFSGNKGFHIAVQPSVLGISPCKDLNEKYKTIASMIKENMKDDVLDMKIYDKRRLIRIDNSVHSKTGLHKVAIKLNDLNKMSLENMIQYASSKRTVEESYYAKGTNIIARDMFNKIINDKDNKQIECKKEYANMIRDNRGKMYPAPCLIYLLENGAAEGERNNSSVALASSLLQNGYSKDETFDMLESWNQAKNEPPLGNAELLSTVNSAYNMLMNGKAFGCNKLSEVSECSQQCRFYNSRQK